MSGPNEARADGYGRVYQASGDQHIVEHHHHVRDEHHHHAREWSGPDSVRHPSVGRAPVTLRDRVGEMDRLRAAVEPGVGNRVYVLHGLGGCGKTAVAYTLFRHATENAGRVGLWVNASDPASLRSGMLAVAADRGATDAELTGARGGLRPAADLVWHYLDRSSEPWLLVLDNADTPAILRAGGWLRTSPAGIVVVTTRQAATHWWPGAELLQFGVLPRQDAALVLQDIAPHAGTLDDAAEVADRLGHLPLALTLAGGFLAHQVIDPWTLADYRHRLDVGIDTGPADLVEAVDPVDAASHFDPRHLLNRTWQLSLDSLTTQGLPEATPLLRLLSCWAGDPLPLKLLAHAELGTELHGSRVESALRGLLDHSLTELVPGQVRCLRVHGILLDSVAHATPDDQRERLATTAARLLRAVLPEVPERGAQDPATLLLAPHVMALLRRVTRWGTSSSTVESAADCALRLIVAVHRSGDYASALTLATDAVALATAALPTDNACVLGLRLRVGRALFRLGRFEESEALYQELRSDCERALGPDAPETLEACLKIGSPLANLGRIQEVPPLRRRVVRVREETLGRRHPLTLMARSAFLEIAANPGMAGLPEQAEMIATGPELLADCYRTLGEHHPLTLTAELNFAAALRCASQHAEALPHALKALAGYEQIFDPDYPLVLNTRHALGRILTALGRHSEAVDQLELLVAGRLRILGPTHPWTRNAQDLLAECLDADTSTSTE
ncbi:tetratricopeptide repeat protein [Streptomyces endophyticus]|uniref:Tetratricopeptide repeat protein n=1 Tax=Streptomyces endophyticus TaxID=714166 RepID=A0ABU6FJP5_9ACTN|nr:tetratricopeptide repeat protein [Streptomyces endophyticus]MEB8343817.1 tetratricopeptide repeat protein [Streptomyces endophyticus]